MSDTFTAPLSEVDPEIAAVLEQELGRQRDTLEMIASENFVPRAVLAGAGLRAHQQVRRGLPRPPLLRRLRVRRRRRDARDRPRQERCSAPSYANVQPHSGAIGQRRGAARAIATPGDTHPRPRARPRRPPHARHEAQLLRQALRRRTPTASTPRPSSSTWTWCASKALEHKPKVIIAGWSAYPRQLDFAAFRAIADEVGAHALGRHGALRRPRRRRACTRRPVPHAHVVSSTVHKTIGGPRSGFILTNDARARRRRSTRTCSPASRAGRSCT